VTVTYTHPGKNDKVILWYGFPSPAAFQNRFYAPGGGGYTLSASSVTGGLAYGAVSAGTDAGYDGFNQAYDAAVLYGNGSINYDATFMFGYRALGEMTLVGKALTNSFYGLDADTKVYTYFEGCSDGGREAWSQVQRWGVEYDGVIAGAPAFRYGQQQVVSSLYACFTKQIMLIPNVTATSVLQRRGADPRLLPTSLRASPDRESHYRCM